MMSRPTIARYIISTSGESGDSYGTLKECDTVKMCNAQDNEN